MKKPWILGLSASHNGSACLLEGDRIVAAVQEERLTRVKRQRVHGAQPSLAVQYCLEAGDVTLNDLDLIVTSTQGRTRSTGDDIHLNPQLQVLTRGIPAIAISHHAAHAVSAWALSGFKSTAILVVDGLGSPEEDFSNEERAVVVTGGDQGWECISLYEAHDTALIPLEKHLVAGGNWLIRGDGMPRFRSLGGMYSAVAYQIFGDPMEAGQVMGLAPLGSPEIRVDQFLSVENNQFEYRDCVPALFPHDIRWPENERGYKNLASSVQAALEFAILNLCSHLKKLTNCDRLCYAGGVALNGVVNERVFCETGFTDVFVPPPAEDSGVAIGAAYWGLWQLTKQNTKRRLMADALGCCYSKEKVFQAIATSPTIIRSSDSLAYDDYVDRLTTGQFCGWFQGRSEFGPRALGQRSILADPRDPQARDRLNSLIKCRASFRPFAPAVLAEHVSDWFEIDTSNRLSPFMLRVWKFKSGCANMVPSVAHVDGTGRVQTVTQAANPRLHAVLTRFFDVTGVPMLLNTSFNGPGEPIVETPDDAIWCMLGIGLDCCLLDEILISRDAGLLSLLDLCPQLLVDTVSATFSIGTNAESIPPRLEIVAKTTWGDNIVTISRWLLGVLRMVDGQRTGWEIARHLESRSGVTMDPKQLVSHLLLLRSRKIIKLVR